MTTPVQQQELSIQRLYLKDLSWETPSAPHIFTSEWTPDMSLDVGVNTNDVSQDIFEVILTLTATVKSKESTAFIAEVKYAGIFNIKGFGKLELGAVLGSYCPAIIYPYAREVISDIVTRGSFPQLILAPINFDALYAEQTKKQPEAANTETM